MLRSVPFDGCTTIHLFIHPSLNCPKFLALANNPMNNCIQVFVWKYVFTAVAQIPRNGIDGSYNKLYV